MKSYYYVIKIEKIKHIVFYLHALSNMLDKVDIDVNIAKSHSKKHKTLFRIQILQQMIFFILFYNAGLQLGNK